MIHALLICCAMLGDDAKQAGATADDRVTYQAFPKKAGETPAAHVQLALWCEAHSMAAECDKHFKRAVSLDPANAPARGLLGLVAFKGKWAKPEQVEQKRRMTPSFRRFSANTSIAASAPPRRPMLSCGWLPGAWKKASRKRRWFTITGHAYRSLPRRRLDQARLQETQRALAVKPEDLAAQKKEIELQKHADTGGKHAWRSCGQALDSKVETRRLKAEQECMRLSIPAPLIWSGGRLGTAARNRSSSRSNCSRRSKARRHRSGWPCWRSRAFGRRPRRAAAALSRRDPRDVIGRLIDLVHRPYKYQVVPGAGPGSTAALLVDGERFDLQRLYRFPAMDVRLAPPMYNITRIERHAAGMNPSQQMNLLMLNYRLNVALAQERQMMIAEAARETMQMDLAGPAKPRKRRGQGRAGEHADQPGQRPRAAPAGKPHRTDAGGQSRGVAEVVDRTARLCLRRPILEQAHRHGFGGRARPHRGRPQCFPGDSAA